MLQQYLLLRVIIGNGIDETKYLATVRTVSKQHVEAMTCGWQGTQPLQTHHYIIAYYHEIWKVQNRHALITKCQKLVYAILLINSVLWIFLQCKYDFFNNEPPKCISLIGSTKSVVRTKISFTAGYNVNINTDRPINIIVKPQKLCKIIYVSGITLLIYFTATL